MESKFKRVRQIHWYNDLNKPKMVARVHVLLTFILANGHSLLNKLAEDNR